MLNRLSTLLSATVAIGVLACASEQTTEPSLDPSLAVVAGGRYTIGDLGTLGGTTSSATGLNGAGQVVGWSSMPARSDGRIDYHPFIWKTGVMRDLHFLVERQATVRINGEGQVVGTRPEAGYFRAFLWEKGVLTGLGVLTGRSAGCCSLAFGINSTGQVVGKSDLNGDSGNEDPFLWENGVMKDLGFEGGATGLNDAGQVVGALMSPTHAFLWTKGVRTDLGTLGGGWSGANAINQQGQIVGASSTAAGELHAFLWQNGVMKDLGTLGGDQSIAYALNDVGQVVGVSRNALGKDRAFLWENGRMIALGTLGGSASTAYGINRAGRIVGKSRTKSGQVHATLWRPT
jgi:probable HAF family extracellular repeat protein